MTASPSRTSDSNANSNGVDSRILLNTYVVKRNNETKQPFERMKISRAIDSAFKDINGQDIEASAVYDLTEFCVASCARQAQEVRTSEDTAELSVEAIQDIVQGALMNFGHNKEAESYVLYRDRRRQAREQAKEPDPNLISDYVTTSKYSRYIPEEKRRESWSEAVDRVKDMHKRRYPDFANQIDWAFEPVYEKKMAPSMRTMQFGGDAIDVNNARNFNCTSTHIDRQEAFSQVFWLLLCGCGVGYSIQWQHVEKMPALGRINDNVKVRHHVIKDSIEGWADALHDLVRSYFNSGPYVEFAYHKIRDQGVALKTGGGKAPGHRPLKKMLDLTRSVLDKAQGRQLRPIECHHILCHAADAVLSGGIRRSAMIALFSPDDGEMMQCKTGEWYKENLHFSRANNSVVLLRQETKKDQIRRMVKCAREFGEPGFILVDDPDHCFNPCVPSDSWITTSEGPRQVKDLEGRAFTAVVDGEEHASTPDGFYLTGVQPLLEVVTEEGVTVRTTPNEKVMVETDAGRTWKQVWNLEPGERLVLHDHYELSWGPEDKKDNHRGWLLGFLVGDGYVDSDKAVLPLYDEKQQLHGLCGEFIQEVFDDARSDCGTVDQSDGAVATARRIIGSRPLKRLASKYGITEENKHSLDLIESSSSTLTRGFLRGLFDSNSSIQGDSIWLVSSSKEMLVQVQRMLLRLGIKSSIYGPRIETADQETHGDYPLQATWDLAISNESLLRFYRSIGFDHPSKKAALKKRLPGHHQLPYRDSFTAVVSDVFETGDVVPVYDCTIPGPHAYDCQGVMVHNCVEAALNPRLTINESNMSKIEEWAKEKEWKLPKIKPGDAFTGFSFCNLCSIALTYVDSVEEFHDLCKRAALIGTLQASYTDFHYLGWISQAIAKQEALLGVSLSGIMDNPEIGLDPEALQQGARLVNETNVEWAEKLGVEPSARTTLVKPEGTWSLAAGCIGSGIHPHHATEYFRRIEANVLEPVYRYFKSINPHMCYENGSKAWIIIPVKAPDGAKLRSEMSFKELFDAVLTVQENWVLPGTARPELAPGHNHNVSVTATVRGDEWDDAVELIYKHRKPKPDQPAITAMTLMGDYGDKSFSDQYGVSIAPREAVVNEKDWQLWHHLIEHYKPVDFTQMIEEDDNTDHSGESACAGGTCETVL